MANFANEPLLPDSLPRLVDADFVAVDRNYLKVSLLGAGVFAALVLIFGAVLAIVVPTNGWMPVAAAAILLVATGLFAVARAIGVKHIAYQVRDHDLSYRRGVIVRTVSTIPFVRVQHVRISRGPVERWFGLATVEVSSAGPDLRVAGLAQDTADWLKAVIIERAGDLVEEP